jgi:hypothetical protein
MRPPRDTEASAFASILEELVERLPGAHGAALVDAEGECVDCSGRPVQGSEDWVFDLKVAAANFAIVLADAVRLLAARTLIVRGARKSFVARALSDGYAVVVVLGRRAGFTASRRALDLCERALALEAGWPLATGVRWYPVRVECEGKTPSGVAAHAAGVQGSAAPRIHPVEVLGALVSADARERGFRVRLDTGIELTIVREAGGFWYADDPVPIASARSMDP